MDSSKDFQLAFEDQTGPGRPRLGQAWTLDRVGPSGGPLGWAPRVSQAHKCSLVFIDNLFHVDNPKGAVPLRNGSAVPRPRAKSLTVHVTRADESDAHELSILTKGLKTVADLGEAGSPRR